MRFVMCECGDRLYREGDSQWMHESTGSPVCYVVYARPVQP